MSGTNQGLNPNDIVDVTVSLSPTVPQATSQDIPLIIGNSGVIDVVERIRTYTGGSSSLTTIAAQFGDGSAEYLSAQQFFEQQPQAQTIKIGEWAEDATSSILHGGPLSVMQQAISNFTGITNGSLDIIYGSGAGTAVTLTGLNFASCTTLQQVAAVLNTALATATPEASANYDPLYLRFNIATAATGTSSVINFATAAGSGTDISSLMNLRTGEGGSIVAGIAAETPVECITILRALDVKWYTAMFTVIYNGVWQSYDTALTTAAHEAVAAFIEACQPPSVYLITSNDPECLVATSTTDIAAVVQTNKFKRTTVYYSSSNGAVALEMFASFAVVDYSGSNTATIAMFKALPGVVAETLTEEQASTLTAKYGNVYVNYSDNVAIVQNGQMGSGNYFDEIHSTDALAAQIQNQLLSYLITQSATGKVPQTDQGNLGLQGVASAVCAQFVGAGVIGKNLTWQGPSFGSIVTGQVLPAGYYIYQAPVASQSIQDRQARKATLMQSAINLAGATQNVSVAISVTR